MVTWWIWQILFILGVTVLHTFNRYIGLPDCSYTFTFSQQWVINTGWQAIIAPTAMFSYAMAPSFLQPWFLGTALISLFGFATSFFIFGEPFVLIRVIGVVCSLVGAILLIV